MRVRTLLLTLALLLFAAKSPAQTLDIAETGDIVLDGRFRLVGGHRSVSQAVDTVCEHLDVFTRLIARPILEDRNRPYETIDLRVDVHSAEFTFDDWGPIRTPLDRARAIENPRGELVTVVQRVRGDSLVQELRTEQGTRFNTIRQDETGALRIETRIVSPRLPTQMRYRLFFRKAD